MNPAALAALLRGDYANAMVASTPGGIEAQEAAGQRSFVNSSTLPKDCDRKVFEQMGIIFGEDADDIFVRVVLPEGWRVVPTEHSMNNELLDDKGRKRAHIFYKAAFYDRHANAYAVRRYRPEVQPINGWEKYRYDCGDKFIGVVLDQSTIIWKTDDCADDKDYKKKYLLGDIAEAWLTEHYPDWKNPLAYWD